MVNQWKELLPIDHYQVTSNGIMHEFYRKTLTTLYQPLVGALAYSLYMTFWSQMEEDNKWSARATHRSLMNIVQLDLDQFLHARKKLEGIGLLTTYLQEKDGERCFYYELETPMSPHDFLNDGALNVYLYNQLGNYHFNQLKKKFLKQPLPLDELTPVTASFNDVFESIHPTEMMTSASSEIAAAIQVDSEQEYVDEGSGLPLRFTNTFDMEWFIQSLSNLIVPQSVITDEIEEAIKKLAYVYMIEPLQMQQIFESAYIQHDKMTVKILRKAAHEWYTFQHNEQLPQLSKRVQPEVYIERNKTKQPETEEEKAIQLFESISPYEQLKKMAGGATPVASDIKLVENIMFEQKLNPGVINVLIEYVMRTNDMKLTRGYVEKIAAHWARKQVKTVKEAVTLAQSEHKKYTAWSEQGTKRYKSASNRNTRKDQLPKWFKEKERDEKRKENVSKTDPTEFERQKKQLERQLKKYSKSK